MTMERNPDLSFVYERYILRRYTSYKAHDPVLGPWGFSCRPVIVPANT
jgi:hypothetical protein